MLTSKIALTGSVLRKPGRQDVLPLLVERLGLEIWLRVGAVVDLLVARGLDSSDDACLRWVGLINAIARRRAEEFFRSTPRPAPMYTATSHDEAAQTRCWIDLTPTRAVRRDVDAAR